MYFAFFPVWEYFILDLGFAADSRQSAHSGILGPIVFGEGSMMRKAFLTISALTTLAFTAGSAPVSDFYLGTHLTHATSRLDHGFVYRDENGTPENPYKTWARLGGNFVMMDHFVSCGYYGLNDIVKQSKWAEDAGLKVGINFHYSQHYGPDTIPHGWPQTFDELAPKMYQYTDSVLNVLSDSGITVDLVKVGNELDWAENENGDAGKTGLLFPIGNYGSGNKTEFMEFLRQGCRAVRDFDESIPIAIHLMGHNASKNAGLFKEIADSGVSYDICAQSWYSEWGDYVHEVSEHFATLIEETGKAVMITECGFPWTETNFGPPDNNGRGNGDNSYEISESGARKYYLDLIDLIAALPDGKGVGVVTWPGAYTYNAAAAEKTVTAGCDTAFMRDPFSTDVLSLDRSTWDNTCFWHSETGNVIESVISAFDTCVAPGEGLVSCETFAAESVVQSSSGRRAGTPARPGITPLQLNRHTKIYVERAKGPNKMIERFDCSGRRIRPRSATPNRKQ